MLLTRQQVEEKVKSAREKGERPRINGDEVERDVLSNLDLRGAILTGSFGNLIGADLRDADLSDADLSRTMFRENPLAGMTDPDDEPYIAIYNDNTKFPEGFDPEKKSLRKA